MNNKHSFYLPELDGLRFVAFLLVFIHHAPVKNIPFLSPLNRIGWVGVDIFFSLSAFLLTRLLIMEKIREGKINVWNFFVRRMLRIWPLYFVYVIFFPALYSLIEPLPKDFLLRETGLLIFTDNVLAAIKGFNPILATSHLWTISYEEQFYIVLPFLVIFLLRRSRRQQQIILICLLLAGFLFRLFIVFSTMNNIAFWVLPITRFESVFIGMVAGLINFRYRGKIPIFLPLSVLAIGSLLFFPNFTSLRWQFMLLFPLVGIGSGGLLFSVFSSEVTSVNRILSNKIISFLGKISFGLYVFHIIVLYVFYQLFEPQRQLPVISTLLSLLFTILSAIVSYYILERPFLKFKKKYTIIPSRPV